MKEKYVAPKLEIIKFLAEDVIVTSLIDKGDTPGDDNVKDEDIWETYN